MATEGEEVEYESDPEEAMLPLAMRRREASDDEEGEEEKREKRPVARGLIGSDGESDGQGGVEVYEDEESEIEEAEEGEEEDVEEEDNGGVRVEEFYEKGGEGGEAPFAASEVAVAVESGEESATGDRGKNQGEEEEEEEEEKKENEPFAVPTAGAFYMHDDRFRDNGSARHRCSLYLRSPSNGLKKKFE